MTTSPLDPNPPYRHGFGVVTTRIEGPAKVTGVAQYESDVALPRMAHAALVTAATLGTLTAIDVRATRSAPGVLDVLTHDAVGEAVRPVGHIMAGGYANSTARPLLGITIAYPGQIVALVIAETVEAASACAALIDVIIAPRVGTYEIQPDNALALSEIKPSHHDSQVGSFGTAFAGASATIDADYTTPTQHHNPMELFSTLCAWDGDHLTVHEPSRFVVGLRHGLAAQLGIAAETIRVVSTLVGGHFGSRLGVSQYTALVALAARRLGRPVKLVPTRRDGFTIANHRPATRHRIQLGATGDGRLVALSHDATVATSRFDDFAMIGTDVTAGLYACPAVTTKERLARLDLNTPGPMRAPPEVPYLFALESAMDELAYKLALDPIEFRRRNDTATDPVTKKRYTTRPLMRCFDAAASAFGWDPQRPTPGSRRIGDWLVGTGCASAVRPVKIAPATVRLTLTSDGGAVVETAHHEIGTGITTLLAMAVTDGLGIAVDHVTVCLGDTDLPPAGISGGSSTTTSLINAMAQATSALRAQLATAATSGNGALAGADAAALVFADNRIVAPSGAAEPLTAVLARCGAEPLSSLVAFRPDGSAPDAVAKLREGHLQLAQLSGDRLASAFGAQFAEVHVHALTGEIKVVRLVGAFAAGRILNPMTAHSQLVGGMIWGEGSALLEATDIDPVSGKYVNADLADYLVPTAADTPDITAFFIPDDDPEVNPAGVKGLGEIGIIGVNAAIANAIFAATGRRIRSLPIRIDAMI